MREPQNSDLRRDIVLGIAAGKGGAGCALSSLF